MFRRLIVLFALSMAACAGDGTGPAGIGSVSVSPAALTIALGDTGRLFVNVRDTQGKMLYDRPTEWTSGDPGIVGVSETGLVFGIALGGPVLVTATVEGRPASASVVVVLPSVASVTIEPGDFRLTIGASRQLAAILRDAKGRVLTDRPVAWGSSNASAVTVSSTGLARALAPGSAVLTATSEGVSDTVVVDAGLTLSIRGPATVKVGDDYVFVADGCCDHGHGYAPHVTWSVSDSSIATITPQGEVVAQRPGIFTIRADSGGVVASLSNAAYDWVAGISDGVLISLSLQADQTRPEEYYPRLGISCSGGRMGVGVSTNALRVQPPEGWGASGGFMYYDPPTNAQVVALAQQIAQGRTFSFSFTDSWAGKSVSVEFRVTGLAPRLMELMTACQLPAS